MSYYNTAEFIEDQIDKPLKQYKQFIEEKAWRRKKQTNRAILGKVLNFKLYTYLVKRKDRKVG